MIFVKRSSRLENFPISRPSPPVPPSLPPSLPPPVPPSLPPSLPRYLMVVDPNHFVLRSGDEASVRGLLREGGREGERGGGTEGG